MAAVVPLIPGAFTVPGALSTERCGALVRWTEALGYEPALVHSRFGSARRVPSLRNNDRVIVDDPALSAQLWERFSGLVPRDIFGARPLGLNERFRFYRYDPGQRFGWHSDGSFRREGERSQLTLLIYLNQGFQGGETRFEDGAVVPEEGLALVFAHRLRHKSTTIELGRKYVLRTDVMYSLGAFDR